MNWVTGKAQVNPFQKTKSIYWCYKNIYSKRFLQKIQQMREGVHKHINNNKENIFLKRNFFKEYIGFGLNEP